jgi:hypothetical protein
MKGLIIIGIVLLYLSTLKNKTCKGCPICCTPHPCLCETFGNVGIKETFGNVVVDDKVKGVDSSDKLSYNTFKPYCKINEEENKTNKPLFGKLNTKPNCVDKSKYAFEGGYHRNAYHRYIRQQFY